MKRPSFHAGIRRIGRLAVPRQRAELELRRTEIDLARRQVRSTYASVLATVFLSSALLTLTFCQWRTAESTAAIERAKARPHFRIQQENQDDELGFLPRRFVVQADAGVSSATRANAKSIMSIQFVSRTQGLSGNCRASFVNFYGWTNDAMSFELNDPADRLMNYSRRPDTISQEYIRLRPLWVLVDVNFTDLFEAPGHQTLRLAAGQSEPLNEFDLQATSQVGLLAHLEADEHGRVVVYTLGGPKTDQCEKALEVMKQIAWLRIAEPEELPRD